MKEISHNQLKMIAQRNRDTADGHWSREIVFCGPDGLAGPDGVLVYYVETGQCRDVEEQYAHANKPVAVYGDLGAFAGPDVYPYMVDEYAKKAKETATLQDGREEMRLSMGELDRLAHNAIESIQHIMNVPGLPPQEAVVELKKKAQEEGTWHDIIEFAKIVSEDTQKAP